MPVKSVGFQNYKAFKTGELSIKPITVLLGANSSGKSSILQLILLLAQTVNSPSSYENALRLHGKFVQFGEGENIFHNKVVTEDFSIYFKLATEGTGSAKKSAILGNTVKSVLSLMETFNIFYSLINPSDSKVILEKMQDLRKVANDKSLTYIPTELLDSSLTIIRIMKRRFRSALTTIALDKDADKLFKGVLAGVERIRLNQYSETINLISGVPSDLFEVDKIKYTFRYKPKVKRFEVSGVSLTKDDAVVLEYCTVSRSTKSTLKSDIFHPYLLQKNKPKFCKTVSFHNFTMNKGRGEVIFGREIDDPLISALFAMFNDAIAPVTKYFDSEKVRHVSPIRAYPKRYYFIDDSVSEKYLDTSDGDNVAVILKKDKALKQKINKWLKRFNYTVDIQELKDIVHSIKVNQNELQLDITDVGFGISQILPVIIQGFLATEGSTTIIEQPEIHIHPRMQSEIADLMIELVKSSKRKVIVETHSDAFLKRLRRRMAEYQRGLPESINPEDVAIHFVEGRKSKKDTAIVKHIDISKTGSFQWPKDFMASDIEDTIEYMKYQ